MEVSVRKRSRLSSKKQETPTTSESETQVEQIAFDEIFKYYDFEPSVVKDPDVEKILKEHKARQIKRTISQLNRAMSQMVQIFPDFSPLEYYIAFDKGHCDLEDILLKSTDKKFKKEILKEAKEKMILIDPKKKKNAKQIKKIMHDRRTKELYGEEEDDDDDDDDDENSDNDTIDDDSSTSTSSSESSDKDDSAGNDDDSDDTFKRRKKVVYLENDPIKHKLHQRKDPSKKVDLPLPEGVNPKVWHKWSQIHQASYLAGIENPNTYFYRNCAPGVKQKNGPWSKEEKKLFMTRLEEMKNKGSTKSQWGIFSKAIPGRVGYQCANFYRKLVMQKEIEDPAYYTDEDGVLRHKKVSGESRKNNKSNYDKKHYEDEPTLSRYDRWAKKNPFEHAIDLLTGEEIKVPAMSPDGYVLDYMTWLKCIQNDSMNPFTKQHINKRQIKVLKKKNIDQYRDKITHIQLDS